LIINAFPAQIVKLIVAWFLDMVAFVEFELLGCFIFYLSFSPY